MKTIADGSGDGGDATTPPSVCDATCTENQECRNSTCVFSKGWFIFANLKVKLF